MLRRGLRWIQGRSRPSHTRPVILMYHRIADELVDPWGLAVSPAHFEEQLQVLRRVRYPLPLTTFVRKLKAKTLPAHAVAITFDDGYADNLHAGKPCLAAADVPATVFLATRYLNCHEEFWWDELARLILLEQRPKSLEVEVRGTRLYFEFDAETSLPETNPWRAWSGPQTRRQQVYLALWRALRPLEDGDRHALMAQLRSHFESHGPQRTVGRAMTREEARALAKEGLVMIGAHSVTHPLLTELEPDDCRHEIVDSKLACEEILERPVEAFSYPFGEFNTEVRRWVEDAGFTHALSTNTVPISGWSDLYVLPRFQVLDCDGDEFDRMLQTTSRG
jgi:peptidoglycan/xylan/chitin deacetylase (PgdA/CDA1 family)